MSRSAANLPRLFGAAAIAAAVAVAVAIATGAACRDRSPVERCADSLAGVWRASEPAPSGEPYRFHILDRGAALEVYPIFDDAVPPDGTPKLGEIVYAPAVIDLQRDGERLHGTESRRLSRGPRSCVRKLPAEISRCEADQLTLDVAGADSIDWESCAPHLTGKRRALRLRRE